MTNVVRANKSRAVKASDFGKGLGYETSKNSGGETLDPRADIASAELDLTAAVGNAQLSAAQRKRIVSSVWFNLDNGAGATVDDVVLKASAALTVLAARIVYVDATTGTVAAGNARVGTTLGGSEIVASTAYENAKAVGTETPMTIVAGAVPAGGAVFVRHTGVAITQAGQAVVEIEFSFDS